MHLQRNWFAAAAREFLVSRKENPDNPLRLMLLLPGGVFHNTDLFLAWLDHLHALLQRHPDWDINCCGEGVARSVLEYAAMANHLVLCTWLLQHRHQVAYITQEAFKFAIAHHNLELVRQLLGAPGMGLLHPQQRQDMLIWALCYAFGLPGTESFRVTQLLLNHSGVSEEGMRLKLSMLMRCLDGAPHLLPTFVDLLQPHQLQVAHTLDAVMVGSLLLISIATPAMLQQAIRLARSVDFDEAQLTKALALAPADPELRKTLTDKLMHVPYVP